MTKISVYTEMMLVNELAYLNKIIGQFDTNELHELKLILKQALAAIDEKEYKLTRGE